MPFDGTLNEISRVLLDARALIEIGWCQNAIRYGDAVCMRGAIESVDAPFGAKHLALDELKAAIGGGLISVWNDAPERSKEEVLAAFDRAIFGVSHD